MENSSQKEDYTHKNSYVIFSFNRYNFIESARYTITTTHSITETIDKIGKSTKGCLGRFENKQTSKVTLKKKKAYCFITEEQCIL